MPNGSRTAGLLHTIETPLVFPAGNAALQVIIVLGREVLGQLANDMTVELLETMDDIDLQR